MEKDVLVWSAIATHPEKWDLGFHQHSSYEVAVLFDGKGGFQWGEKVIPIEEGHVILIPQNLAHRFYADAPIRLGVFQIKQIEQETRQLFQKLVPDHEPCIYTLSAMDLEQYLFLFRQWLRSMSESSVLKQRYTKTWIELLLLFLLQHVHAHKAITAANAADYIRSNLREELRISDLAKQAGLSDSGFRKMFKKVYGLTPKQYQQQCRMAEAQWLLRSTDKSIQFISEEVGFMNLHSFSSWFQSNEGFPPTEWRKKQRTSLV